MTIDTDKISALIRECAAACIIPRFKTLAHEQIFTKTSPTDLVTIADREAEEYLDRALTKMFPDSIVIGEEGISAGHKTVTVLQDRKKMIWVTDPVDGTWNFVHGNPEFAVMLACVIGGETRYGWIYDVPGNRMLTVEQGAGVFIEGVRQKVANPKPLVDTNGFAGSKYFSKMHRPYIKAFQSEVRSMHSISCAGHEYIRVISGLYDFGIYSRSRPWDHLAGTLAVKEAGGVVRKWDGTPYTPQDDFGGIIVASNETLRMELQEKLINTLLAEGEDKTKDWQK
jgi:fructose-1,6-bisphosphatase/inositol monophosphatase family enzyme